MFVSIPDVLLFCNEIDTIVLRMFGGIGNRTNIGMIPLRCTRIYWEILHESWE